MKCTPLILFSACFGLMATTFAASAQTVAEPAQPPSDPQIAAQADLGQADALAANQSPGDDIDQPPRFNCLQYTGSRIRSADRKTGKPACNQQPGRTYGRDDIARTGQTDLADALRHLDPSIK
ncbi:MAG TPA: hypothetical protein VIT90_05795 [Lysobacter sp.]